MSDNTGDRYDSMNVEQLKEEARTRDIDNFSTLNKADLQAALREADRAADADSAGAQGSEGAQPNDAPDPTTTGDDELSDDAQVAQRRVDAPDPVRAQDLVRAKADEFNGAPTYIVNGRKVDPFGKER